MGNGADSGTQYRTGIYFTEPQDEPVIEASIAGLQKQYDKPSAIEVLSLKNYSRAEESHQKYLDKNPNVYCHIGVEKLERANQAIDPQANHADLSKDELNRIFMCFPTARRSMAACGIVLTAQHFYSYRLWRWDTGLRGISAL